MFKQSVPRDWRVEPLQEVAEVQTGIAKGKTVDSSGVSLPYLRVANVQDGRVDLSVIKHIRVRQSDVNRFSLRAGDVLFTEGGDFDKLGRGAVWGAEIEPCLHQNHVFAVRPDTSLLLPELLAYYAASDQGRRYFQLSSKQSTNLASINSTQLKQFPVLVPPLPEQRKIVDILRTWDAAIEKVDRLIDRSEQRNLALTHSLVFGQSRPSRFQRSRKLVKHQWFALPVDWKCQPIGELAQEVSERNGDGNDDHEVLSCSKYDGFVKSLDYFKKQVFSADLAGYKKIRRGYFGFPSNHIEEGSIGLQNVVDTGLVSPIYTVFRFIGDSIVDPSFAFGVFKSGLYRHIFEVSTSSSVDRRGSLRWSQFSKIPFPVPPFEEQRAIIDILGTHQQELKRLRDQRLALERQKRGLMQKLLTGQWRVKV